MIGITKDDIRVGDWISREDWIKTDRQANRNEAITGYRVSEIEDGSLFLIADTKGHTVSYKEEVGWLLMCRVGEKEALDPPKDDPREWRHIVL